MPPAAEPEFLPLPAPEDSDAPSHPLDENPRYLVLPQFRSRFLPDRHDLFVYLPEAYLTEPERRFPVFFLHDGQNLFDERRAFSGRTWRAHLAADATAATGRAAPVILVGISNAGTHRLDEYTPTRDRRHHGGAGPRYGAFLVQELKPLIDRTFRTLPGARHTALGGSSLGGLITLSLGLDYPDVFGRLAVMSPSVWWDCRAILALVDEATRPKPVLRIWLDMGTSEGLRHLRDTDLLHRRLLQRGWREHPAADADLRYLRVPGAGHNEDAWADRFDEVLAFLFPPGE